MRAKVRKPRAPVVAPRPRTYEERVMGRVERNACGSSLGEVANSKESAAANQREQQTRRIDLFDRTCRSVDAVLHRVMPRGKYKDWEMEDVPTDYLRWCLDNWEDTDGLLDTIEKEYRGRPDGG